jgi:hypothetical protein
MESLMNQIESLPEQQVRRTGNRHWKGRLRREFDEESEAYLSGIANVDGRIEFYDGIEGNATFLERIQTRAIASGTPWAAALSCNVLSTNFFREMLSSGRRVSVLIGKGRAKLKDAEYRSNVGSMVVIFYPEVGDYTMRLA